MGHRIIIGVSVALWSGLALPADGQSRDSGMTPGFLVPTGFRFGGDLAPNRPITLGVPKSGQYQIRVNRTNCEIREDTATGPVIIGLDQDTSAVLNGPTTGTRYGKQSGNGPIGETEIQALQAAFGLSDEDAGFPAWLDLDSDGYITLADHSRLVSLMSKPELVSKTFWIRGLHIPNPAGTTPAPWIYDIGPGDTLVEVIPPDAARDTGDFFIRQFSTFCQMDLAYRTWRFPGQGVGGSILPPHPILGGPGLNSAFKLRQSSRVRVKGRYEVAGGPTTPEFVVEVPTNDSRARRYVYESRVVIDPLTFVTLIPGVSPLGLAPGSLAAGSAMTVWMGGEFSTTRVNFPLRGESPTQKITIDPFPAQWFKPLYNDPESESAYAGLWCGEILANNPPTVTGTDRLKYYDFAMLPLAEQFGTSANVPPLQAKQERWSHYLFQFYTDPAFVPPQDANGNTPPIPVDVVSLRSNGTEVARLSNVPAYYSGEVSYLWEPENGPFSQSYQILSVLPGVAGNPSFGVAKFNSAPDRPVVLTDIDPPPGGWPGVDALKVEVGGSVVVIPGGAGW